MTITSHRKTNKTVGGREEGEYVICLMTSLSAHDSLSNHGRLMPLGHMLVPSLIAHVSVSVICVHYL